VSQVFNVFQRSFVGKASPVHLFWGALDLAVTRFSGRTAPPHPAARPLLGFLQATWRAAADAGGWDRDQLERHLPPWA
jgi:Family of unknown function (DUF5996)